MARVPRPAILRGGRIVDMPGYAEIVTDLSVIAHVPPPPVSNRTPSSRRPQRGPRRRSSSRTGDAPPAKRNNCADDATEKTMSTSLSDAEFEALRVAYPDIEAVSCPICTSEPSGGPIYRCARSARHFLCGACFSDVHFNEKCPMCREPMPKTGPLRHLELEAYIRRAFTPTYKCAMYDACNAAFYTQGELGLHERDACGWQCPVAQFNAANEGTKPHGSCDSTRVSRMHFIQHVAAEYRLASGVDLALVAARAALRCVHPNLRTCFFIALPDHGAAETAPPPSSPPPPPQPSYTVKDHEAVAVLVRVEETRVIFAAYSTSPNASSYDVCARLCYVPENRASIPLCQARVNRVQRYVPRATNAQAAGSRPVLAASFPIGYTALLDGSGKYEVEFTIRRFVSAATDVIVLDDEN